MDKKYLLTCMLILTVLSISSVFATSSFSGSFKVSSQGGKIQISSSYCGNSVIEAGEQCDKNDLGGQTCNSLNSAWTGTLSCRSYCVYDTSGCSVIQQPPAPTDGGGGGGGGGGSYNGGGSSTSSSSSSSEESCIENWKCDEWSNLDNECGVRSCNDLNKCGTALLKPETSKKCPSTGMLSLTGAVAGIGAFVTSKQGIISFSVVIGVVMITILFFVLRKGKAPKNQSN